MPLRLLHRFRRGLGWSTRMHVTRAGWYFVVVTALIFTGAMLREVNLLLILGGMLCGSLLLGAWLTRRALQGLRVERHLPEGLVAGELLVGQVDVHNARRRGTWGLVVEDRMARTEGADVAAPAGEAPPVGEPGPRPQLIFPFVPPGASCRGVYRGTLARRGRYQVGPLRVMTRFPFGLFARWQRVGEPGRLIVYPRLGRLIGAWDQRRQEALTGTRRRERRQGPEGDFFGLRDWRTGDSLRHVHWRRTAHVDKPVVRQFERPRNRDLAVLLDPWSPDSPRAEHADNVELAVSFAATLLTERSRRGGSELLLVTPCREPGEIHVIDGPASPVLLHEMMSRLAVLESRSEDRLPELIAAGVRRVEPGTQIVIVATRPLDLGDLDRFEQLRGDPVLEAALRSASMVDTSGPELRRVFRVA